MVAPLTKEDASELFSIVGAVEGLAARRAAEADAKARKRLVTQLKEINHDLFASASAGRPDRDRIFNLDSLFHRTYVEAGAGARLLALHDAVKPQAERYVRLYINSLLDRIAESVDEHVVTVTAIEAGDPEAAQQAVNVNWRNADKRLAIVIENMGERGSW